MDRDILLWPFSHDVRKKYRLERRQRKMDFRLIMTLVVRNEEDIIEKNIRFHCAMGVDGFIVTAHLCTDRTCEILEKLKQEGLVLQIIEKTSPEHQHHVWVEDMIRLARSKYHADWIINADADEFFYSVQLNLKTSIAMNEGANILSVDSIFYYPQDTENYWDSSLFVTRPFQPFEAEERKISKDAAFAPFIGAQGCAKVIHQARGFREIGDGNHFVRIRHRHLVYPVNIRLYHYHIRNYSGWEQKVRRWEKSIFLLPDPQGMHMKRMVRLYQEGKLKEEFARKYGPEMRDFLIENGVVSNDPSVANFLKYKGIL